MAGAVCRNDPYYNRGGYPPVYDGSPPVVVIPPAEEVVAKAVEVAPDGGGEISRPSI